MTTIDEVLHRCAEPYKVKLIRGMRDAVGWEVTIAGDNLTDIMFTLREADKSLHNQYRKEGT